MKYFHLSIVLLFMLTIPPVLHAQETPLSVVATTTIIADVARNVGGDLVDVTALIPPDADTHAFQPAPQDAVTISEAAVILVNGANLEEGLLDLVESSATVPITVVSNGVAVLAFGGHEVDHDEHEDAEHTEEGEDHEHAAAETIGVLGVDADCGEDEEHAEEEHTEEEHEHGACDPHVWQNPHNVEVWANNIADAFAAVDPANADTFRANATAYQDQLAELDAELEDLFSAIPEEDRLIVTNHEFLGYLAARYDFEIIGTVIPSLSTLAEPAPQDLADLIETIRDTGVRAVFAEVSDPNTLAQVIAQDVGDVQIVTLYSESLSAPDGPAATYLDYMRVNAQAISQALGG